MNSTTQIEMSKLFNYGNNKSKIIMEDKFMWLRYGYHLLSAIVISYIINHYYCDGRSISKDAFNPAIT